MKTSPVFVHGGVSFPLTMEWRGDAGVLQAVRAWIGEHRWEWDTKAAEDGAILFRNFPVRSAEDFDAFVGAFKYETFGYDESLSNAVRLNRTRRVFTANEAPAQVTIRLHHELAQTMSFPSRLFFFCERPADEGGATMLCRSDALFDRLARACPAFVQACREKGLKYTHTMPPEDDPSSGMGRSWKKSFGAESKAAAEARMRDLGYSWEWTADGCLKATTPVLPAVIRLPSGRTSFFNQIIAAATGWKDTRNDPSRSIRHGDGRPLDPEGVATAAALGEELAVDLEWQRGDVALVDNHVVMHGRRPFKGMRKILASLVR